MALEVDADIMSGECVPPVSPQGELRQRTKNGQPSREVNVKKIVEPDSSDSQGQSDQQQANGDDVAQVDEEEAQGDEEAGGEENNASNQSQENDNSKQGYGCSANP